jgi:tetratricopeptide (TPR) repeat protein
MFRQVMMAAALVAMAAQPPRAAGPDLDAWRDAGHWKRIRAAVEPRYRANPKELDALYWMARVKLAFGDVQGAYDLAQRLVAANPKSADAQYVLAETSGLLGRRAGLFKAFSYLREFKRAGSAALALDPRHRETLWLFASFYYNAPGIVGGDKTRASAAVRSLIAADPALGYAASAEMALQEKDPARAERELRKAVDAAPASYSALERLAAFYVTQTPRRPEPALAPAARAVALDPERAGGYAQLASAHALLDHWAEVDATLARAAERVPDDPSPFYVVARTLLAASRDPARAERCLRTYLAQPAEGGAPDHASARWRLGLAIERQGRKAEARAEFEAALRLRPDFDAARQDLQRLSAEGKGSRHPTP